jgi:hypothetical protein
MPCMRIVGFLIAGAAFACATHAAAQTCRTSLGTGMIICDNGATARTSPVAGTTTFSDGRTARTDPATGTTRFSDGTSFTSLKVELDTRATAVAPPPPPATKPEPPAKRQDREEPKLQPESD